MARSSNQTLTKAKNGPDRRAHIVAGRVTPGMSFNERVWALTARVPKGRITTYGEIARALGTSAYRAVGNALNRNPYAPAVPCHRVVGSTGSLTGFAGGIPMKLKMLKDEGVPMRGDRVDLTAAVFKLS